MAMNEHDGTPHPGRILLQRAMEPLGISRNQLARDLDVPVGRISDITNGKRGITADTALRLGRYFSTGPEIWLRMQAEYDLSVARLSTWSAIEDRVRVLADSESETASNAPVPPTVPVVVEEPVIINPAPPVAASDVETAGVPESSLAGQPAPDAGPPAAPEPDLDRVLELQETWVRKDVPREDDIGIPPLPGDRLENP